MGLDHIFYLSIGSNLGNRLQYIQNGLRDLKTLPTIITSVSSVYETSAIGMVDAPHFLNICVCGKTQLDASILISKLLELEIKNGRTRTEGNTSSRTLDLDIIFFDQLVINTPQLQIPHPRYKERKFVLLPLLEINPVIQDPIEMKPVSDFLRNRNDNSSLKKLDINLFT
jgi:2-amino-4-hydroxy-6-hydroxymethyldihydropteridine diphosphokinase